MSIFNSKIHQMVALLPLSIMYSNMAKCDSVIVSDTPISNSNRSSVIVESTYGDNDLQDDDPAGTGFINPVEYDSQDGEDDDPSLGAADDEGLEVDYFNVENPVSLELPDEDS